MKNLIKGGKGPTKKGQETASKKKSAPTLERESATDREKEERQQDAGNKNTAHTGPVPDTNENRITNGDRRIVNDDADDYGFLDPTTIIMYLHSAL